MTETTINRGRKTTKAFNSIGINLEDTTWIDVPYVEAETDSMIEAFYVWVVNHEFKVWVAILVALVVFL